jgi:hypothetical protein
MLHQSVGRCGFPRTAIISARIDSATSPAGVVTALAYLWAERFDKPVADLFDMQDEIAARLANRLGQELARRPPSARRTPIRWITISLGWPYSTKA